MQISWEEDALCHCLIRHGIRRHRVEAPPVANKDVFSTLQFDLQAGSLLHFRIFFLFASHLRVKVRVRVIRLGLTLTLTLARP